MKLNCIDYLLLPRLKCIIHLREEWQRCSGVKLAGCVARNRSCSFSALSFPNWYVSSNWFTLLLYLVNTPCSIVFANSSSCNDSLVISASAVLHFHELWQSYISAPLWVPLSSNATCIANKKLMTDMGATGSNCCNETWACSQLAHFRTF